MAFYINESMASTPSGTLKSDATYINPYVRLTRAVGTINGQLEYTVSTPSSFIYLADLYANGGADANYLYWGCSSTPTNEDAASGGYIVAMDEWTGDIQLRFNGTLLSSISYSNIGNGTRRILKVVVTGTNVKVYVADVLQIDFTDSVRTLGGSLAGVGARTGGSNAEHRCYQLQFYTETVPIVTTSPATLIAAHTALLNGTMTDTGNLTVTERGFEFNTVQASDQTAFDLGSFTAGSFSESITTLTQSNTYYFRAYARNSLGVGYGSWEFFTTLPDVYNVTINGIDRTSDIINGSIKIEDAINDKQNSCSFQLLDRSGNGIPSTDQEISIDLNDGTRIFGGYVLKLEETKKPHGVVVATITCIDYVRLFDRNLVHRTYEDMTDAEIIADVIDRYCTGFGITGTNVVEGVTITQMTFNYIQPSQVMRKICDLTGRNWYIDYNKDIHYFALNESSTPFDIDSSSTSYFDLKISQDASQLKNRVYVRGGTKLSDATSYQEKGDGVKRKFVVPDKPHDVTVKVNGVTKTLGIKNIDSSGYDWYLNFQEKYVEQDSGAVVLGTGDTLTVEYSYDIPILVAVEDTVSIAASGVQEFAIFDKSISTTQAARDRATAELTDYGNNLVEGSFSTYTAGFRSGQTININLSEYGINDDYIVTKVICQSWGGGNYVYNVSVASAKTMGIIRFLVELLEANKNLIELDSNEVVDELLSIADSLNSDSLQDALTIDSSGAYFTWSSTSLDATPITRMRWDLFQWG